MDLSVLAVRVILAAEAVQLFYWLVLGKGYEEPQIHLIAILLAAALTWRKAGDRRKPLAIGLLGGLLTILTVIYTSDLGLWYAIPHGLVGILFGVAVILCALEEQHGVRGRFWAYLLLFSLAFISVFGKGFTLRAGISETNTVLGIRGMIRHGPAAGILTNYMQAYIANTTYEEFQEYLEPDMNCLVVASVVGTPGTTLYLYNQSRVCHFSIINPATYNERLLDYWQLYPEKYPDVIVVDCWFGQPRIEESSWMMRYIEEDFGYSDVIDGKYVRYYFR